jgi:hypothetical protein
VQVWRHLAIAEVRSAEKQWRQRKQDADQIHRERLAQAQADRAVAGSPGT